MAILGAIAVPHPPLIVPAVGRGEERRIDDTIRAYQQASAALLALKPDCLVITSPHAPLFRDAFHVTTDPSLKGSMSQFGARKEKLAASCDTQLAQAIVNVANGMGIPAVGSEYYRDEMDHATYVPLYFIREAYQNLEPTTVADLPCPIVRIGLSGLPEASHKELGRAIARAADSLGRKVGFIASGDLSHKLLAEGPYGFTPEGPVFDERIGEIFASGELDGLFGMDEDFVDAAAECGLRSFQIMAGAIEGLDLDIRMLSNEGPFGVGYGVATCLPRPAEEAPSSASAGANTSANAGANASADPQSEPTEPCESDPYVELARLSVETYVRTGKPAELPADTPRELLEQQAGAFVSLHKQGELRGCIGTIAATCNSVAEEILQNGISACSRDPRFDPVTPDELDYLDYSVDVLGDAEPIDSPAQLDPVRYGVIVSKGWRRGLLLPNLEGVDTVDYQLAIAKQKAGISPAAQGVKLERFEVVRHVRGGEARKG